MTSSNLPALFIQTTAGDLEAIQPWSADTGFYQLIDNLGNTLSFGNIEQIMGRGNVSWYDTEKKSYKIKLEQSTALLDMNKIKTWVLQANAFDKSLMRNNIVHEMAKAAELPYTPSCNYIDLYINGEYRGNYLLTEKIGVGKQKIPIKNSDDFLFAQYPSLLPKHISPWSISGNDNNAIQKGYTLPFTPDDISGGYLLELDLPYRYDMEASGFITSRGQPVVIKSPSYPDQTQVIYISEIWQNIEDSIFEKDDENTLKNLIDIDSFAKKYLIEEISMNFDASASSQYFYKPEDVLSKKIFAGPVWDYDNSFGIDAERNSISANDPEIFWAKSKEVFTDSSLWYGLNQLPFFQKQVSATYQETFLPIITEELENKIPERLSYLKSSAIMNAVKWELYPDSSTSEIALQYEKEVNSILTFLQKRALFLSENL